MNLNIYKAEDHSVAQKEIDCIMDCSMMLEVHIEKGNFTKALDLTKDMYKSISVLQKLIKEKESHKQLSSIVSKLASIGVDSSIVTKYLDNKKS
ncbi:hypothetical protein [Psychrobacillus psychrodurans]|uniref:hypothetical protein n=1 Tax=Psychrobacillus psychrodurans TaxID=126157 RepID=UPI0008EB5529|nr:hypothetical protein [Psychrobacillus psychrodurans]MCZ8541988.1 hypothetical protein [Psychrobacillus psychrodurans]SFN13643.1 hypothetical protein SAMN05421832_11627 [Psychrobacillus psychrodurans]